MHDTETRPPVDLDGIRETWLRLCGACDAGLPMSCTCPRGDHRPVMSELVAEVDRLDLERGLAVRELTRVRGLLLRVGNEITVELTDLTVDRAAAGGGGGNPTREDQPPPTPTGTGADRG